MANKQRKSADYKIKRTFVPVDDGIFLCVVFTNHYATLDVCGCVREESAFSFAFFCHHHCGPLFKASSQIITPETCSNRKKISRAVDRTARGFLSPALQLV